jgi:predicted dehydrogenase
MMRDPAGSPLRIAVIGAGWGAQLHLAAHGATPSADVVAICSRTRSTAEAVAAKHGVPSVYTSFDEMADREQPDVISIATPPDSHLQYVKAAAERGCHVLCDKPVSLTAAEAEEMLRAVDDAGVRHATGFISQLMPEILKLRSLVSDGAIGEVREVHSRAPLGTPVLPMTWVYDAAAGGGALLQHGQHLIQIVRMAAGQEITAVCGELIYDVKEAVVGPRFHNLSEAFGYAVKLMQEGGGQDLPKAPVTADTGYAFAATMDRGARAYFWEAWHSAGLSSGDQVEVFGSRGTLVWQLGKGLRLVRSRMTPPEKIEVEASGVKAMVEPTEVGLSDWKRLVRAFLDDIRGQEHAGYPTLYDAWKVQQVCDAVRASTRSRAWETIPAATAPVPH